MERDISCFNTVKISVLPQLIYGFNTIAIKVLMRFFLKLDKVISKLI